MGYKVPWVKLWLDPHSKLPVQIHAVVMDSLPMTFNDFHWNESFDNSLLELLWRKGFRLLEAPGGEEAPEDATSTHTGSVARNEAGPGVGILPLPLGEGWGEGGWLTGEGIVPHPNPLPKGEGTCSLRLTSPSAGRARRQ